MRSPDQLTVAFRNAGLKVTPQRQLLFRLLHNNSAHPTAESLFVAASAEMPGISLRTVYQTLTDLTDMGELQSTSVPVHLISIQMSPITTMRCATHVAQSTTCTSRKRHGSQDLTGSPSSTPTSCIAVRVPRVHERGDHNTNPLTKGHIMAGLKGTKTHENLLEAFAGESQANRRYLWFAQKADVEGYPDAAALFRSVAEGETGHAHGHLEYLAEVGDPASGEPIGETELNFKASIAGETYEYTQMYPGFAKTARDEGFSEIADWFETLARAEKSHAGRFQEGLNSL